MTNGALRKRSEVTIDPRRVVVMTRRRPSITRWCFSCTRETQHITAEEAAAFCAVPTGSIYRTIEEGSIHWRANTDGLLWLCIESLAKKGWSE